MEIFQKSIIKSLIIFIFVSFIDNFVTFGLAGKATGICYCNCTDNLVGKALPASETFIKSANNHLTFERWEKERNLDILIRNCWNLKL